MKINSIQKLNTNIEQLLQQEKPLNFKEACEYLDISKSYLYKCTHKNLIPFFKPNGKKIYFLKSELRGWLLRNRQATADEIEQKATDYVALKNTLQKVRVQNLTCLESYDNFAQRL